ncbi:MAG TPA: GntR family transcriptional regulator [Steroidobacteraceae bacterium]|nr:GntR family transcriptional regulator [Steroidobacteraceae bacterium]
MSVEFAPLNLEPAYRKVAARIGERILARELREGERLPSETELARQFGVNRSTVREALRELESRGLVQRRPGSKLMSVSRPHHEAVAAGVSHALLLHDVTVRNVWEALTILEPPLAEAAARNRSASDLECITAAADAFGAQHASASQAVHSTAEFFRCIGRATHNPVLGLAQEPLLQLLEPSLGVMIDKVPQARARIATAQRRLAEALAARAPEAAHQWMARHIRDFRKGYELAGIDLELRVTAA